MKTLFNRLSDIGLGVAGVAAVGALALTHEWEKTHHVASACELAQANPKNASAVQTCAEDTRRRQQQTDAQGMLIVGAGALMLATSP